MAPGMLPPDAAVLKPGAKHITSAMPHDDSDEGKPTLAKIVNVGPAPELNNAERIHPVVSPQTGRVEGMARETLSNDDN